MAPEFVACWYRSLAVMRPAYWCSTPLQLLSARIWEGENHGARSHQQWFKEVATLAKEHILSANAQTR